MVEPLPDTMFRVEMDNRHQIFATGGHQLLRHAIRFLPGDRVLVDLAPDDPAHGEIVAHLK